MTRWSEFLVTGAGDYAKTKEEVYAEMAVWMLEDARSLRLLALDLHEGCGLPS